MFDFYMAAANAYADTAMKMYLAPWNAYANFWSSYY
jgi:hypothetical protein